MDKVEVLPKYPEIKVSLLGTGGNIQVCLARFCAALKEGGVPLTEVNELVRQATLSDKRMFFKVIEDTVTVID